MNLSALKLSLIHIFIVRELTGGIYFGEREEAQGEGANEFAWDKETYSRYEVERIMDIAMETARKRNKKVVSVDKANVLASSRLWRKIAQEKAAANPDIATDYFLSLIHICCAFFAKDLCSKFRACKADCFVDKCNVLFCYGY